MVHARRQTQGSLKADEQTLLTRAASSGRHFVEFPLEDAAGRQFSMPQVTDFGRTSGRLDLGTSRFPVSLHLKPDTTATLEQLKTQIKETAIQPGSLRDSAAARGEVDEAASLPRLVELCCASWRW